LWEERVEKIGNYLKHCNDLKNSSKAPLKQTNIKGTKQLEDVAVNGTKD